LHGEFVSIRRENIRTVGQLVHYLRTAACILRAHDNSRNRPKPRTYVPHLPGRVRIHLYYNVIDFTQ